MWLRVLILKKVYKTISVIIGGVYRYLIMTKTTSEPVKVKKNGVATSEGKLSEVGNLVKNTDELPQQFDESEGETISSTLTEEDVEDLDGESSGNDSDEVMAMALDTILKQASDSKDIIPVIAPEKPEAKIERERTLETPKNVPREIDHDHEGGGVAAGTISVATSSGSSQAPKRKMEVERQRAKKLKKLSKEKRDRLKARVAKQVAELAALEEQEEPEKTTSRIPKYTAARIRQQDAVAQARNRMGLASRYGNLAKLVELHRFLEKGNPFSLIDPKQVYPYFHLVPGINDPLVQPLVLAWQEKVTRILYQLLLLETKGDIARLKKRTLLLKAEPNLFVDAFCLKVDIGLENENIDMIKIETGPSKHTTNAEAGARENKPPAIDVNPPPQKRSKKMDEKV